MRFRPCIDIHNGKVKQIVGGSLRDEEDWAQTNFASEMGADYYANLYKEDALSGGHMIMLNPMTSEYYEKNKEQAKLALKAYPKGLQVGGGITLDNAKEFIELGASHVVVTSYVFQDGKIEWGRLENLTKEIGKKRLVLDLSCRRRENAYYIVTDRWQKFTQVKLSQEILERLADYCDEFLIHGADVEGKQSGVEIELVHMLGNWGKIPITYAGGIGSMEDLEQFAKASQGRLDFTIGSALDLFGGKIPYHTVKNIYEDHKYRM